MKFRYKVLLSNIILLSTAIGIVGYLMIDKSFSLSLDSQIKTAIEENNILQSLVEYNLLSMSNQNLSQIDFEEVGREATLNMSANNSSVMIVYNDVIRYCNDVDTTGYPSALWQNTSIGKKRYILTKEQDKHYVITTSATSFLDKTLNIINKRDITETYMLIDRQANYFRILLVVVLVICSVIMFVISMLLTKPLEHLNAISKSFGEGNYNARAKVLSKDEVGMLAKTYNEMAQSVSEHVDELQDMMERHEQFVADFTHEIKTPMTTIIGYADTIRSKELSRETQIMAASYIFKEGKRLETMSHKLFDFIHTKHDLIDLSPISTQLLAKMATESVLPSYEKSNISLEQAITPCLIMGDLALLCSAFINLLDNARKASALGSKVLLSGQRSPDGYVFTVQDFGIGISEEHLTKICDEFYMVDKSRSRSEGGAGLGLSLAAAIFEKHGAAFHIESVLGEGTTMSVLFQISDSDIQK
ncbi:MAG: HAMP domain-containing histidine kinase [Clostridium sp.]|nr:HAMP domain-containing histidine kinase [Clostridium sp.]